MGLIKAAIGAGSSVLADQWKEYFYCDSLPETILMTKGQKRTGKRSSNTKGSNNVITNGSVISVADGQAMIIVEDGRIAEFTAEPGVFTYDASAEPSVFSGSLGKSILDSFKTFGRRIAFGGDVGRDQRVYYFNTKEIMGNKFGTPSPILFEVVNRRIGMSRTVNVRCNGVYSYHISDPLLFYSKVCGNVRNEFTRAEIDEQLKSEFISALQPAFGALAEQELRPAQLPARANELKAAMNDALRADWLQRGISVASIALNPIRLSDEDMKKITDMEDAASYGSNPFMIAGLQATSTANAMEAAAANSAGAMTGFMGMNMAGSAMDGGFNSAQQFYQMGMQQVPRQETAAPAQSGWKCACGAENSGKFCAECGAPKPAEGWKCACGAVNKGKFCPECGGKKPAAESLYRCDKCGWEPADPRNPPKFCPECGDRFDEGDIH